MFERYGEHDVLDQRRILATIRARLVDGGFDVGEESAVEAQQLVEEAARFG